MQILRLGNNAGISGTIPDSRGDYLHNNTVLGLAFGNLTGKIPIEIGWLAQLENMACNQKFYRYHTYINGQLFKTIFLTITYTSSSL
jgi:hypothetical protein